MDSSLKIINSIFVFLVLTRPNSKSITEFTEENEAYWSDPFKITIENGYANMFCEAWRSVYLCPRTRPRR
jgi:hypothetical protein